MNLDKLHEKLFAAARANPPGDQVPYAFEKRIMARLKERPVEDSWRQWGVALWRGAAACVAITLLCGIWSFSNLNHSVATANFSDDLDQTLVASVADPDNNW